ncbi:transglycosylase domain-containing protein [Streptomyces sp. XM4193]|uniref:transglycosylase domain-containing protein n=1 Tax=Streptomyces sp. XM4193 TaxID=2929782 RepID=UPI0027E379C7|nr:transglycosylase domain-containing protein [Streptomyces sp. XM4193]
MTEPATPASGDAPASGVTPASGDASASGGGRRTGARRVPALLRLRRSRRRQLRILATVLATVVALLCGVAVVAYHRTDIPEPHPETVMQSTVFLGHDGEYLGRRGPVDRQDVPLGDVPRVVQDAVIAAENRSFRTDAGVSPKAVARAIGAALRGGTQQGGSTITQQYVKNALLSPERSLTRKVREALLAVKLDRTRSKDDILEGYLNTVYFGRGAAGIQAAARGYFGVDARDLTLSQGAALAAIINIPSHYEKAGADREVTERLEARWRWTLDAMADAGTITARQRGEARFPAFRHYPPGATGGQQQYLIDAAAREAAARLGITEDELAREGYTVHTTFDLALQDAAAERLDRHWSDDRGGDAKASRLRAAAVALEPGDGAVRLLLGGGDYARQPFNTALDGAIEAGTALEPFAGLRLRAPLDELADTAAPRPVNLTAAYAALVAEGRYATPYTVARITRNGRTVHTAKPEVRSVLQAKEAYAAVPAVVGEGRTGGLAPTLASACHTGGAGGGSTRRTTWWHGLDSQLALSVVLFADRPGAEPGTRRPAHLPTDAAELTAKAATDLWRTAAPRTRAPTTCS